MRLLPLLLALSLASACRHRPDVVVTRVSYLGHDEAVTAPRHVPSKRVFIVAENRRGDAPKVGEDESMHVPITADIPAIPKMVEDGFRAELARVGAHVAPSAQDCDVILKVGINDLKVSEGFVYTATLVTTLEVSDAAGNAIGKSTIEASGTHFGDNYSGEEVNAAVNNALAQVIANAFQNDALMGMLSGS
jgi:hypothetical protein